MFILTTPSLKAAELLDVPYLLRYERIPVRLCMLLSILCFIILTKRCVGVNIELLKKSKKNGKGALDRNELYDIIKKVIHCEREFPVQMKLERGAFL